MAQKEGTASLPCPFGLLLAFQCLLQVLALL